MGGVDEVDFSEAVGGFAGGFEYFDAGGVVLGEELGDSGHGFIEFCGDREKEIGGAEGARFAGFAGGGFSALLITGLVFLAGGLVAWGNYLGFWRGEPGWLGVFSVCEPL